MKSVIVIGAGLGGLAAAIRLAARGCRVKIFERNATLGGKVNIHRARGYSFDTGASLLTMRHVVDDLFTSAGRATEDYLTLERLEIICRYVWADGVTFDAFADPLRAEAEVERIAPEDAANFRRFLKDARRKYEVAERTFLAHSLNDLPKLLRPRYARDLAVLSSWRTLSAHVESYFRSPRLRQLFNRFATYNGSSPYATPATFALIPYVEFELGAWYVRGGMYELPRAFGRLAEELNVKIHTNAHVEQIVVEGGRACGVMLSNGTIHEASAVIANSDAVETYRELIDPRARRIYTDRKLAQLEPSCSGFVLLLGAKRRYDVLSHHNIFFSNDYRAEFRSIFNDLRPAAEPTVYVCAASRTDPSQSPEGCENLFVLVNAPATGRTDWKTESAAYQDLIIKKLETFGLEGLSEAVDYEHTITPEDFADIYRAHRGAIYGTASNSIMSAFLRPPNRARDISGLYFAGGTTHPGGGIPLVLLSGKMAAELVIKDK